MSTSELPVPDPGAQADMQQPPAPVAEQAAEPAATDAPPAAPPPPAPPELSPAACAAQLAQRFPALFAAGRALPIKLRIQADIQQRAPGVFNKKSLSLFLHRHTTSTAYIKALLNAPHRFDLDGTPAGEIADEHRQAAVAEVDRRLAIVAARRTAERDAQRHAAAAQRQQGRRDMPPMPDAGDANATVTAATAGAPTAPRTASAPAMPRQRPPHQQRPPRARQPQPAPRQMPPAPAVVQPALDRIDPAELEARRDRAALLRAFESTTLTATNFCALKGLSLTALEPLLAQARQERTERPAQQLPSQARPGDAQRGRHRHP